MLAILEENGLHVHHAFEALNSSYIDFLAFWSCTMLTSILLQMITQISFMHFSICPRIKEQLKAILEATFTHAKNLSTFVFTYKALTALLCEMESKPKEYHSFLAAFVGGYLVWGKYNKINEQVSIDPLYHITVIVHTMV